MTDSHLLNDKQSRIRIRKLYVCCMPVLPEPTFWRKGPSKGSGGLALAALEVLVAMVLCIPRRTAVVPKVTSGAVWVVFAQTRVGLQICSRLLVARLDHSLTIVLRTYTCLAWSLNEWRTCQKNEEEPQNHRCRSRATVLLRAVKCCAGHIQCARRPVKHEYASE